VPVNRTGSGAGLRSAHTGSPTGKRRNSFASSTEIKPAGRSGFKTRGVLLRARRVGDYGGRGPTQSVQSDRS
jgi:hypothetical protein